MSLCDQGTSDLAITYVGTWKYFKAILIEVSLRLWIHINKYLTFWNTNLIFVYFFNCLLQPFSQDYNLVAHTIQVVFVNITHKLQNIQGPPNTFFWKML